MKKRLFNVVLLPVIVTAVTLAQSTTPDSKASKSNPSSRKPGGTVIVGTTPGWEMTDEERITRRIASSEASARVRPLAAGAGYTEGIDGHQTPELFLPYELFDFLLWGLSADTKRHEYAHRLLDPKIRTFGHNPDEFWATIGSVAEPYISAREIHRQRRQNSTIFTTSTGKKVFIPIDREVCAARLSALQQARRSLGGKDFDRFLYSAVAPEFKTSEGGNTSDRGEQLRYMAGGCQ